MMMRNGGAEAGKPPPTLWLNHGGAWCDRTVVVGNTAATDRLQPCLQKQKGLRMSDDQGFDQFWGAYPRRVGKGHARKAWITALKKADGFAILSTLYGQINAGMFDKEPPYIPHPSTWLNAERWEDEIVPRKRTTFRNGAVELLAREYEGQVIGGSAMIGHGDD